MNGEGKRSKEAVRKSVRAYGVKVMDPAMLPLKNAKETNSLESVTRFSEKSLHSQYQINEGCCKGLLNRIPYATLHATLLCIIGIIIMATAEQRAAVLTNAMISDILRREANSIAIFDLTFLVLEIVTGTSAIMILIIGILATGDTRAQIYKALKTRVGGRVCCAILMLLSFMLFFIWLAVFWIVTILGFLVLVWNIQCDVYSSASEHRKFFNIPMINIFFPGRHEEVELRESLEIKKFCKDFVEKAAPSLFAMDAGALIILISLVLFITCLAANYARIRCQAKFQELEELRHLEGDLHNSHDRF